MMSFSEACTYNNKRKTSVICEGRWQEAARVQNIGEEMDREDHHLGGAHLAGSPCGNYLDQSMNGDLLMKMWSTQPSKFRFHQFQLIYIYIFCHFFLGYGQKVEIELLFDLNLSSFFS